MNKFVTIGLCAFLGLQMYLAGSSGPARRTGPTVATRLANAAVPPGPPQVEGPATPLVFLATMGSDLFYGNGGVTIPGGVAELATNSGGMAATGALMPISGSQQTPIMIGQLNANNGLASFGTIWSGPLQVLPATMTFTKMNAIINPQQVYDLTGVKLTVKAELYRFERQGGSGRLDRVPGAECTFTDASTLQSPQPIQTYENFVSPGEVAVCSSTFSATIPAGDSLMWLVSMTSSSSSRVSLTQRLGINASIALSQ